MSLVLGVSRIPRANGKLNAFMRGYQTHRFINAFRLSPLLARSVLFEMASSHTGSRDHPGKEIFADP